MKPKGPSETRRKKSKNMKQSIIYPLNPLTPSEIEQLRQEKKEANAYFRKVLAANKPDWIRDLE